MEAERPDFFEISFLLFSAFMDSVGGNMEFTGFLLFYPSCHYFTFPFGSLFLTSERSLIVHV